MFLGVPWVRWAQGKGLGQGSGVGLVSPTPLNLWHITASDKPDWRTGGLADRWHLYAASDHCGAAIVGANDPPACSLWGLTAHS